MPTAFALLQKPLRTAAALGLLTLLAACANGENLGEMRPELGDFRLCYNIVTTNDTVKGPLSREADLDEFAEAIRNEIDRRFGRYEGDRLYHIAIHMDAYVLAVPGIPLVASPRSALIISSNLWDDALGRPLNEEPEQMTVLEAASGETLIGSGLTQSAEQQMLHLAANAALRIEDWLAQNPEWFIHDAEGAQAAETTGEAGEAAAQTTPETAPEASAATPATTPPATDAGTAGATADEGTTTLASSCGHR